MEKEAAAILSAIVLLVATLQAYFLGRRSLDPRARIVLAIALVLALPLLISGAQTLASSIGASLAAMPVGAGAALHVMVASAAALIVALYARIPDRVARWAWTLPVGLFLLWFAFRQDLVATERVGALFMLSVGLAMPRIAALAISRKAHAAEGGIATVALVLLFLPALGSSILGIVWTSDTSYSLTWSADIEPSGDGTWTVTIPFAQSDAGAVGTLIERVRADVRVETGDATFRAAPDVRGLLVDGRGPALLVGRTIYESSSGRQGLESARIGDTPWTLEGVAGMQIRWILHEGCGTPLTHVETLGAFPTPAPPPSPSSLGPCVHGD